MYSNLLDDAIKFFGITTAPRECGFICPNGEMLDFSGRHLAVGFLDRVYKPNRKNLVHGNIFGVNLDGFSLMEKYPQLATEGIVNYAFMNHTSAVRVDSPRRLSSGTADYLVRPTEKQIEAIANIMQEQTMYLSKSDVDGNCLADCEIKFVTKRSLREAIDKLEEETK